MKIGSTEWNNLNTRRADLLVKAVEHTISPEERVELTRLQDFVFDQTSKVYPRPPLKATSEQLKGRREIGATP